VTPRERFQGAVAFAHSGDALALWTSCSALGQLIVTAHSSVASPCGPFLRCVTIAGPEIDGGTVGLGVAVNVEAEVGALFLDVVTGDGPLLRCVTIAGPEIDGGTVGLGVAVNVEAEVGALFLDFVTRDDPVLRRVAVDAPEIDGGTVGFCVAVNVEGEGRAPFHDLGVTAHSSVSDRWRWGC